jgi:hypothetical protein
MRLLHGRLRWLTYRRLPIVNRIVRIVTGHADASAGPTASGSAGQGEAGRPQDCAGGHAGAARRMAGNGAGSHTTGAVRPEPVAMASVNRMTR